MLPLDGGGRYAGPEHIEPRRLQTLLHYLIIFCKIYSATEGINTEFITFHCKYEHGEGERISGTLAQQLAWDGCIIAGARPGGNLPDRAPRGSYEACGSPETLTLTTRCCLGLRKGSVSSEALAGAQGRTQPHSLRHRSLGNKGSASTWLCGSRDAPLA